MDSSSSQPPSAFSDASSGPTPFDALGGAEALRAIIRAFVGRIVDDPMIGFMFAQAHRVRLETFEYQHAAVFLGALVTYRGRPLAEVHARFKIAGGQFARRRQILAETLAAHGVPPALQQAWLAHQDALRPLITGDAVGACHGRQAEHLLGGPSVFT